MVLIPAHLIAVRDVDGLVGRHTEHAGLPHRGQLLWGQQGEHGRLAEVHHGFFCQARRLQPGEEEETV